MPKSKKNIKVRDLKPNKDAKGGGGHPVNAGTHATAGHTVAGKTGVSGKTGVNAGQANG